GVCCVSKFLRRESGFAFAMATRSRPAVGVTDVTRQVAACAITAVRDTERPRRATTSGCGCRQRGKRSPRLGQGPSETPDGCGGATRRILTARQICAHL